MRPSYYRSARILVIDFQIFKADSSIVITVALKIHSQLVVGDLCWLCRVRDALIIWLSELQLYFTLAKVIGDHLTVDDLEVCELGACPIGSLLVSKYLSRFRLAALD